MNAVELPIAHLQRPARRTLAVASMLVVAMVTSTGVGSPGTSVARRIDASTVTTGIVTRDGVAAGGVDVIAEVWPNQQFLDGLADGDQVPTMIAAQTVTAADGWFGLLLNPNELAPQYLGADGQVDISLIVADASNEVRWNFSSQRNRSPLISGSWTNPRLVDNLVAENLATGMASTHLQIDIGSFATVIEEGDDPAEWIGRNGYPLGPGEGLRAGHVERAPRFLADVPRLVEAATPPVVPLQETCSWRATSSYQNGRTEDYVRAIGLTYANVTAIQTVSASHSLGVAVRVSSTWSQGGTITRSTTASSETNYGASNAIVQNKVNYRMFEQVCLPGNRITRTEWRPNGFHSLNTGRILVANRPNWNTSANCTAYSSGTHTKERGSNATFSTGVDLAQLGVSANAKFERSNAVKLRWTFTRSGGRLCGSTSSGWVSAAQAGAFVTP